MVEVVDVVVDDVVVEVELVGCTTTVTSFVGGLVPKSRATTYQVPVDRFAICVVKVPPEPTATFTTFA